MESKININRVMLGGFVGGLTMLAIGFLIHAVLLHENYTVLQHHNVMRQQPIMSGMMMQYLAVIFSGIPLAALYAMVRNYAGPGPGTAIKVGALVGLVCVPVPIAVYAYYNVGGMVPLMTAIDCMAGCIAGTFVAGALYKD